MIYKKFLIVLIALTLTGCAFIERRGFKRGYEKAKKHYDPSFRKVRVPAYSYGFMRGWNYYELERARKIMRGR